MLLFVFYDRPFVDAVVSCLLLIENKCIRASDGNPSDYQYQAQTPRLKPDATQRMVSEARLARTVPELSMPGANREVLDEEYRFALEGLKSPAD